MKRLLLVVGLYCGLGAACNHDTASTPAQKLPKTIQKRAAAAAQNAQEGPQFSYSPVGIRDPFLSYLAELQASNAELVRQRKKEPTETYELDQYHLTGLVTGTAQPYAMVEDPEGRGHVIRIGARLGKRGGVVTRINSEGIVVTEDIITPTGEKVRFPTKIDLPQPELQAGVQK
jgi:type IV pilus assembly protein PilP